MQSKGRKQLWADLLLLLVTLIWGGTFVMVKEATAAYPVLPFLALRFTLAAVAMLAISWRRLKSLSWPGVGAGALLGLFVFGGYLFQTLGLQYTTASKAGFITGLSVVIVPMLSALLFSRRPSKEALIGVGLATLGMALLSLQAGVRVARGDLLVLACAFSFALHIVGVSRFAGDADPLALTFVQTLVVALASGISGLVLGVEWPRPSGNVWAAAAFTGIIATALAFSIQMAMQRFTTATHTALIFSAEPVFAALFGVMLANDVLTAQHVVGGLLILAGTIVSEIRWSDRTAELISRFLAPHYVTAVLLVVLGLADPDSRRRGIMWVLALGLPTILGIAYILNRELRKGGISDWHISKRQERLRPVPLLLAFLGTGIPLAVLILLDGPKLFLAASLSGFILVVVNMLITIRWKISQHVSGIALGALLVTSTLGYWVFPVLFLIPLVAWARVKIGAHTVMQTVAGGITGLAVTVITLRLLGLS